MMRPRSFLAVRNSGIVAILLTALMEELNPLTQKLAELRHRAGELRGYL